MVNRHELEELEHSAPPEQCSQAFVKTFVFHRWPAGKRVGTIFMEGRNALHGALTQDSMLRLDARSIAVKVDDESSAA